VRNWLTDEGWPLGIGLQEQIPNHLWRLWSKGMVVSAEGKGPAMTGQVSGSGLHLAHPLDTQGALHRHQLLDLVEDAVPPELPLL